jgi:lysophospholipase L1-like esterase
LAVCRLSAAVHRRISIGVIAQCLLMECAVVLALWIHAPWGLVAGLVLLGCSLLLRGRMKNRRILAGWIACALCSAGASRTDVWKLAFAGVAGMIAAALWLNEREWRKMAFAWSLLTAILCVGAGYLQDRSGVFYLGLLSASVLLILVRTHFNVSPSGILLVNTLLLAMLGMPAANLLIDSAYRVDLRPETWAKYYSYKEATGKQSAFVKWWLFFHESQYPQMGNEIFDVMPDRAPSHRLRPSSHGTLLGSSISINSRGFRGREIAPVKGNTYRIVALGESTTFGMTISPDDKPWPELLEQMIHERLKLSRPVEVINAGVPGYSLEDNLARLSKEILPLKPDMIISYHGYNGFGEIDPALPAVNGPPPPVYKVRPLDLLADCEYRVKMILFRRQHSPPEVRRERPRVDLLDTRYANEYSELIVAAETNRIRLALANFSMAVNSLSDSAGVEFYRIVFDSIDREIKANEMHSLLVKELAARYPDVCFVDTHPQLDGENEKFIDLIHLTQRGRQQLAENIFAGIRKTLEKDEEGTNCAGQLNTSKN